MINGEDIITEDGKLYYGILQQLHKLGYATFDSSALHAFLSDKPDLKIAFDGRGGYKEISNL